METRIESDKHGPEEIPIDALWGLSTKRYQRHLRLTDFPVHPVLVKALTLIKKASATTNGIIGEISSETAETIVKSCNQILAGELQEQIVVDALHGAGGWGLNKNLSEVLANNASKLLGGEPGSYSPIHPREHVDLNQSCADTYVTAMRLAILLALDDLEASLLDTERMLRRKSLQFDRVVKPGRINLKDCAPITLGQELNSYGSTIERALRRLEGSREIFREVNLGGGDIGTGFNTSPKFQETIVQELSKVLGQELRAADDYIRVSSSMTDFAHFSSSLKEAALDMGKIASDLRLLSSGPQAGIAEIILDARLEESPLVESLLMICHQIAGNDLTVSLSVASGNLESNSATPLIIEKILESMDLLQRAGTAFVGQCLAGLSADQEQCLALTANTDAFIELLATEIGMAEAARVVKNCRDQSRDVKDYLLEGKILHPERIETIFGHRFMTSSKRIIPFKKEGEE